MIIAWKLKKKKKFYIKSALAFSKKFKHLINKFWQSNEEDEEI